LPQGEEWCAAIVATAFTLLLLAASPIYPWMNYRLRPVGGPHAPYHEIGTALTSLWHQRFSTPLQIVVGGYEVAAYVVLRWSCERLGRRREALAAFEQERVFAGETPTTRAKHAHVLAVCGNRREARELLQDILTKREEQWITAYEVAVIYALLEDNDNALLWLARAEREHAVGFTFIRVDPHLDNLRTDSRFAELLRRIDNSAT